MTNSSPPAPLSQWQRLLKNVGTWQGSFTQVSVTGDTLNDTPTQVALIPQDDGKAMHQEVRRYATSDYSDEPKVQAFDYRSLSRAILFFETGAFSQGSTQWGPFSQFGAELGLIAGDRRLRLVPLFETTGEFKQLTLIREQRQGTNAPDRQPLQASNLLGTWEGIAVTQYADLRPEQHDASQLVVEKVDDRTLRQILKPSENSPPITSTGILEGNTLSFQSSDVQVLFLPDGASATFPRKVTPGKSLFLEAGWLLNATTRQRLIRSYDTAGAWISLTLVTERKIA